MSANYDSKAPLHLSLMDTALYLFRLFCDYKVYVWICSIIVCFPYELRFSNATPPSNHCKPSKTMRYLTFFA